MVRTLSGRLIYHDEIRKWFELKLHKPTCGHKSIQLTSPDTSRQLEIFRGCQVRSTGQIDYSPTGYYSLELFQGAKKLEPAGACIRKPPFPDHSGAWPDKHVNSYRVDMYLDYRPGDHPVLFRVHSAGRSLSPWQAYADYWLTGGYVLYGLCGKGFVVDEVFGPRAAHPSHFEDPRTPEDMAMFDPESAALAGKRNLHLGYTCIRQIAPKR